MPGNDHHLNIHKSGWVILLPASLYSMTLHPALGCGMLTGYFLGRYIDPDLDILGISGSEGRIVREFPIAGKLIVGYTTIYGALFYKYHRSFITHFPGVSTLIRLIFMFWWMGLVITDWQPWHWVFGFGVWLALSMSDLGHFISDKYFSESGNSKEKLTYSGKKSSKIRKNKERNRREDYESRMDKGGASSQTKQNQRTVGAIDQSRELRNGVLVSRSRDMVRRWPDGRQGVHRGMAKRARE